MSEPNNAPGTVPGTNGTPSPAPAVQPATAAQAPAQQAPAAPALAFQGMTLEQFNERLAQAEAAGSKKALAQLGAESIDAAKAALDADKKRRDAELSAQQKLDAQTQQLATASARATALEASVKGYLDAEEKAIPEDKRALLELAPPATDPSARLQWIANAKAKGLFAATTAPAAASTPANTKAGGTAPATGNAATPQKKPSEMNDAEYAVWKQQRDAGIATGHDPK